MEACESIRKTGLIAGCCNNNNNNRAVALMATLLDGQQLFRAIQRANKSIGIAPPHHPHQ